MSDVGRKIDWAEEEFKEVRPGIYGATVHTPQLTATLNVFTHREAPPDV